MPFYIRTEELSCLTYLECWLWSRTHHSGCWTCPSGRSFSVRLRSLHLRRALWVWWWDTAQFRHWASRHCTSPAHFSIPRRAARKRRPRRPAPDTQPRHFGSWGCTAPKEGSMGKQPLWMKVNLPLRKSLTEFNIRLFWWMYFMTAPMNV